MSNLINNATDAMELWNTLFPERSGVPLSQFAYWIARNEREATMHGITEALNKDRKQAGIPTKNLLAFATRCMITYKEKHDINIQTNDANRISYANTQENT